MEQMLPIVRIEDSKVEEWLRCPERFAKVQTGRKYESGNSWRKLVQASVSCSINDFYKLPIYARTADAIETAIEKRWTRQNDRFHSNEHYLQIRQRVTKHVTELLLGDCRCSQPIISFKQLTAYVEELEMELCQSFHLITADMEGAPEDYIVQRFTLDTDMEALELLFHMTSVFGISAFDRLPTRIKVLSVLDGSRTVFNPDEATLLQSMDYMYLVKSIMQS